MNGTHVGARPGTMTVYGVNSDRPPEEVDHVVILVHGIRTHAPWQNTLRVELEREGIRVELTNYEYFDLFRFLVPLQKIRWRAIDRVLILIRDVRKQYPNAKISFLAHSFGTYILANILRREFDFRAHRIVFCGSVVRSDFPFHEIADRFTSPIVNEVGSKDHLPALAESVTWGYGSAGTYGFRIPRIRDRWHNDISHSQFLTEEFCRKFWVPFFARGEIIEGDNALDIPPSYIRLLSRLKVGGVLLFFFSAIISALFVSPLVREPRARAVLYMQTAQIEGKVVWTSPLEKIEAELPPEHVVEAAASLPSAGDFELSLFPNTRRGWRFDALHRLLKCSEGEQTCVFLPSHIDASQLLSLRITLADDFQHGIVSKPVIRLKQTQSALGFSLLPGDDFEPADWALMRSSRRYLFLYSLSNDPLSEQKNLWNLKELPLIEIDISYSNETHGYLVLEKGAHGETIIRDTLQGWGPRYQR
jgi:hypothetical protein